MCSEGFFNCRLDWMVYPFVSTQSGCWRGIYLFAPPFLLLFLLDSSPNNILFQFGAFRPRFSCVKHFSRFLDFVAGVGVFFLFRRIEWSGLISVPNSG